MSAQQRVILLAAYIALRQLIVFCPTQPLENQTKLFTPQQSHFKWSRSMNGTLETVLKQYRLLLGSRSASCRSRRQLQNSGIYICFSATKPRPYRPYVCILAFAYEERRESYICSFVRSSGLDRSQVAAGRVLRGFPVSQVCQYSSSQSK